MALLPTPPQPVLQRRSFRPLGNDEPTPPPGGLSLQQPLPSPPPGVTKKPSNIWDKDHLAETLAGISQAFLSNQNFGEGLGAAAGAMGDRMAGLRKEAQKSTTYGGPDNRFEITTDGQGNRSIREVPEFARVAQEEREAKAAPKYTDVQDRRSRALYAVSQLPADQRQAAYADLLQNAQAYGVETAGMPSTWSDTYGAVAGGMGLNVHQALTNERNDRVADNRIATNDARTAQGAQRIEITKGKDARAALKASAPPSTRRGGSGAKPVKGYSIVRSRAEFNALPTGSKYIAPDGSKRIKQ